MNATLEVKVRRVSPEIVARVLDVQTALASIRSQGGKFFKVAFERKTPGKNGEPVGSVRRMTARLHVRKYVKGVLAPGVRAAEDAKHAVLTVWDVEAFQKARKEGKGLKAAGRAAYRRINVAGVVEAPTIWLN